MRAVRATSAIAAGAIAVLLMSVLTAFAVDGTGTNDPPPKIAFVAHGINPADALAAGPIVAQVGGVLCTTHPNALSDGAKACLEEFDPEMVVIVGGTAALSADIAAQIKTATGLDDDDIKRAAGADRYKTAQEIGSLLADLGLNVAFLPVDGKASDADMLDGLDGARYATPPLQIVHSANDFVGSPSTVVFYNGGKASLNPDDDGILGGLNETVYLGLTRPTDFGPTPPPLVRHGDFGLLTRVTVCYEVDNADDAITFVELGTIGMSGDNASFDNLWNDNSVNLNSTSPTCVDLALPEDGIETLDNATLQITYTPTAEGSSHELHLLQVETEWDYLRVNPPIVKVP